MQVAQVWFKLFQRLEKRHVAARPARIIELPRAAEGCELLRHAPDRRDADAAGKQHDVFGVFHEWEIVARRADLDLVADFHLFDDIARAAAAVFIALDADRVAVGIAARRTDQRELPQHSIRQVKVDMRAGLVGRQLCAVEAREREKLSLARDILDLDQVRVDQAGLRFRHVRAGCGWGVHAELK